MSNVKRQFISMPYFLKLNEQNLIYLDVLTYIALKSFDNPKSQCFPSYETIANKARLSKDFVIDSIKRLKQAKYIRVWRKYGFQSKNKSYSNQYYFLKHRKQDYSFMIPREVLNDEALHAYEKAMLICLFQFSFTPYELTGSIKTFADNLGLTYKMVYRQYNSLVAKGYIDDTKLKKNKITKLKIIDLDFTQYLKLKTKDEVILRVA